MENIIQQVHHWFERNWESLARSFTVVDFRLSQLTDKERAGVSIGLDGPLGGASIAFWNKGEVEALALDKRNGQDYVFDDRRLNVDDDIDSLMQSYLERLAKLLGDVKAEPQHPPPTR